MTDYSVPQQWASYLYDKLQVEGILLALRHDPGQSVDGLALFGEGQPNISKHNGQVSDLDERDLRAVGMRVLDPPTSVSLQVLPAPQPA